MFIDAITLPTRAVLLDVDGTILDLAPTPLEVVVPPDLTVALERLSKRVGGALAFVSGRPLAELDLFFQPLKLPSIAGHGAELRSADGTVTRATTFLDPLLKEKLATVGDGRPGVVIEDKGYSMALHYRLAPHLGAAVREEVTEICATFPSASLEILPGKSVVEVKQPHFNKGSAVRILMHQPPFKDRRPIFIGDDVTDEAAFDVMPEFDGVAFSVGREVQGIAGMFPEPSDVRRWIAEMVRAGEGSLMNVKPDIDISAAQQSLDLAVVGNGRTLALVNPLARIVWWCFPRFDSDPVFCRLLGGDDEKGFTDILLDGFVSAHSEYVRNTAIVTTVLTDRQGASVRITDFAPRFEQFGRTYRPPQLMRIIEPVAGLPRITIRFRPTSGYGQANMQRAFGSSHIRYTGGETIRLTTDAPLSYIDRESPFVLTRPLHLVFGADTPFDGDFATTCRDFCDRTRANWQEWIRRLNIANEWQDAVIRAAITLKLSAFEETGAIVAAHTTSIPEAPGSGRTWDYRFCWLRDAYFVVRALNRIGASRTMEDYISYILTIVSGHDGEMQPVYSIVSTDPLEERIVADLKGYRGDGPVRIGNAAVAQNQHDTYGSVILAATPMFFDRRLPRMGDENLFRRLEPLGEMAVRFALEPDAGIWEYRERRRIHTHSVAMCWAGCQRLEAIAAHLGLDDRAAYWGKHATRIQAEMLERAWNPQRGAFTAAFGADDLDASVLLLPELGAIEASDPRFVSTVNAIERELKRDFNVMRYTAADDFGLPETAFLICRFWLIDALWAIGRRQDARDMFVDALKLRNSYGLMSEDVHPGTKELWGNFPQTYSMAGIILSAIRLSQSWEDRYWRGSS